MKKVLVSICVIAMVAFSVPAFADILNGGFETGNFSGWTTVGQTSIVPATADPRTNNTLITPIGTYAAKVGDQTAFAYSGVQTSSISQTWTVGSGYDTLYFAWSAVGLVPTNGGHDLDETPWFRIRLYDNTKVTYLYDVAFYTGNPGSIQPGWYQGPTGSTALGQNSPGIWYYRPWTEFSLDLANYIGDNFTITLETKDCDLSGHAMYAYLDGFGYTKPPITSPEPTTMLLLGLGLVGLAGLRKRS